MAKSYKGRVRKFCVFTEAGGGKLKIQRCFLSEKKAEELTLKIIASPRNYSRAERGEMSAGWLEVRQRPRYRRNRAR